MALPMMELLVDFRRASLAYVEAPNSILVRNKKHIDFLVILQLPLILPISLHGPMAVWGPVLLS